MKRLLAAVVVIVFLLCGLNIAIAETEVQSTIQVKLDGKALEFDVPPQIINGRTLVPLRAIFEALGAKVDWDGETKTVTGTRGNTVIKLTIDNVAATVNGVEKILDVPGTIINDRTLVPVRFISESLGAAVEWNGAEQTVIINSNNNSNSNSNTNTKETMDFISNNIVVSTTEDAGARISAGNSPYAMVLEDGRIRLYYGIDGNIESAISTDGINFKKENGIRIKDGAHPTVIKTSEGKYRMYYGLFYNSPFGPKHKLASAISNDGLNFVDEGIRIEPEDHYATYDSAMEAVQLPDGKIRIYVITDNVFNDIKWKDSYDYEGKTGISSLISSDGLKFTFENGKRSPLINFNDPSAVVLPNGYYWIITAHAHGPLSGYPYGLHGFITKDGLEFSLPKNILPQTSEAMFDPSIVKVSADTYRVYYGQGPGIKSSVIKINTSVVEMK